MKLRDLANKKSYKGAGVALAVIGLATSVFGFFTYQLASADVTVVQRSDIGLILIIAGVVMIIGAVITFVYLVRADFS